MIKLGFNDLTADEARKLLDIYETMRARHADIERTAVEVDRSHPTPPPAPVIAPAAAPSTGPDPVSALGGAPSTGNLTARVDARGVPWDERFHSGTATAPGSNPDGSWRRRRGSDKDAVKAYEAHYLSGSNVNPTPPPPPARPAGAPATTVTAPASGGASAPAVDPNNPLSYPPAPPPPPPPPAGTPSYEDFAKLWTQLCAQQAVTVDLETWIKTTYGGHPVLSDVFKGNPVARKAVWDVLLQYQPVAA